MSITDINSAHIVIGLLVIVCILLTVMVRSIRRQPSPNLFVSEVDSAINRLGEAVRHHTDVNAVLALTQQFKDNPDLLLNLAGYTKQVVAAALLHRVNSIGNDIKAVQDELTNRREVDGGYGTFGASISRLEQTLTGLHEQLREAERTVDAFRRDHAIS